MNANKTEVDHQLISPDEVKIDFPLHGQSLSRIYPLIYDRVFPRFPRPDNSSISNLEIRMGAQW